MARIILKSLECLRRHDLMGVDEPEVGVGDETAWRGVIAKGEKKTFREGVARDVEFVSETEIRIWEWSDGVPSLISRAHEVPDTPTSAGLATFKTSGTHYELRYRVVA